MATTTNYGWTTPDDTALVKDGASAIRTLGSSVDTTTKNLNPETTLGDISYRSSTANVNTRLPLGTAGQVLKVNSGATAPEWATDATGMSNPMTTTGDTIYSSSGSTPARLAIGSTGNVLTVAGGVPTWAAPAGGSLYTLLTTTTLSGASTTISSIDQTYSMLKIVIDSVNTSAKAQLRISPDGVGSGVVSVGMKYNATLDSQLAAYFLPNAGAEIDSGNTDNYCEIDVYNYAGTTQRKLLNYSANCFGNSQREISRGVAAIPNDSALDSLVFTLNTGTFSGGTVQIYGAK